MGKSISNFIFLAPLILSWLCSQFVTANASDIISPSKFIKDPEFIISQSGVFRLGFFGFPNSSNRYVGIWYNHIPQKTVVWVANRNNLLKDTSGVMNISNDGNLIVVNGQQHILWTSNVSNPTLNTTAQLLDSGNLVLKKESITIWESFQYPSHAFLPTMKLTTNIRTGQKVKLRSWKSPSDPSDGNFTSYLEPMDIRELTIWDNDQLRCRSGPWNGRAFVGAHLKSVYRDGFSVVKDDDEETYSVSYALSNKSTELFYRLNSQGIIIQQLWDAAAGTWDDKTANNGPCDAYGTCGPFGVCDPMKPTMCSCSKGFEPKNREEWNRENWTSGCVRTIPLQCQKVKNGSEVGKEDGFLKLETVKAPAFPKWSSTQTFNCKDQCLRNCSCVAYADDDDIGCMLWSGDLIDILKLEDWGTNVYIRVASSELDKEKDMSKIITVIAIIGGIITVSFFAFLWTWTIGRKQKNKRKFLLNIGKAVAAFSKVGETTIGFKLQQLPLFKIEELATATNNFHGTKMLGKGGFGSVYRGTLRDGKEIAVKRLSTASSQGLEEFMNEVVVISKVQHRNLVRLLGCCVDGEEKMLVYEYMPNKSLDAFLFDPMKQEFLGWKKRFDIIQGISKGLLYLHRDSRLKIIHRDLKASNILLDQDLIPKISDFGMARIFGDQESQANTKRIVGTYGYMSPEYAMQGQFSEKSDVFSFGVLLLEIVSGRKNTSFYNHQNAFNLLGYAWKLWKENNILGLVEMGLNYESINEMEIEILRCIRVGLLCVQDFAEDRPTMSTIVSMLNSEIVDLPSPKQPAFIGRPTQETDSLHSTGDMLSMNEVSITTLFGGR